MAKINNAVRVIEFENEEQFYHKIQDDLISYMDEPDSRCYKVKNIQENCRIIASATINTRLNKMLPIRFIDAS